MSTTPVIGEGRLYPQLLRKPGLRPWQCAVGVLLFAALVVVVQVGLSLFEVVLFGGFGSSMGVQEDGSYGGPAPVLYGVLLDLAYVGFAVLAVAWAFTVGHGWIASVAARVRWRVALFALPALVVAVVLQLVLTGVDGSRLVVADPAVAHEVAHPVGWAVVGVLVALSGALVDEVVLRGWLAQSFGALLPGERAALVLAAAVSCAGYVWWRDPSTAAEVVSVALVGLVLFAVATLTGGLEASFLVSAGLALALVVPYAAAHALDVTPAPRAATWVDVVVAAVAGAVAVVLARRGGAVTRGLPEGRGRTLSDLSQVRGVR